MTIKPLLPEHYDPATILDWWAEKRKDIQRRFQENIGTPPFPRDTRAIEMMATTEAEAYVRTRLRYLVGEQEEIHAYLFVPKTGKPG